MDEFRRRAIQFGAEFVDLETVQFTPSLLSCIPEKLARKHRVLPVAKSEHEIAIVTSAPSDIGAIDDLHVALQREIEVRVADESQIDSFIKRLYGDAASS